MLRVAWLGGDAINGDAQPTLGGWPLSSLGSLDTTFRAIYVPGARLAGVPPPMVWFTPWKAEATPSYMP